MVVIKFHVAILVRSFINISPTRNIQYKLNSDQVLDFYSRDSFNSMDQVVLNETKYPLMGR
ncbi:MAG: hypothetical protein IPJ43_03525 [Saprospiraceae bacterium]|nr:hypothetical protein [Saprospiraceae bacterium]